MKYSYFFTLEEPATTSAGVYDSMGVLIRTLWSNRLYNAGSYVPEWDGLRDDGTLADDIPYKIVILSNNINVKWEGVIGNTSHNRSGTSVHRSFLVPYSICYAGNSCYYAVGYNERNASVYKFDVNKPQTRLRIMNNIPYYEYNHGNVSTVLCTDGSAVFIGGFDSGAPFNKTFVYAINTSDDNEIKFPSGTSATTYARTYPSAIGVVLGPKATITGLAVQRTGVYLFKSHAELNQIHVINKRTGNHIRTIQFDAPKHLAIDQQDQLWIISGKDHISKHNVNGDGTISLSVITILGVIEPYTLQISEDFVLIVDGSTSQLKKFSTSTGNLISTYGKPGGYVVSPLVEEDKFCFKGQWAAGSSMAFQSDGTFWLIESGNHTIQHRASDFSLIEHIMYMPNFRSCNVDPNESSRVFLDFHEFEVDTSLPLLPDNNSWKLKRNWYPGIPSGYADSAFYRFGSVTTLSNGKTYALCVNPKDASKMAVLELPENGHVRITASEIETYFDSFNADGSLQRLGNPFIGVSERQVFLKKPLVGFDSNDDPLWGDAIVLDKSPEVLKSDPVWGYDYGFKGKVIDDIVISYDTSTPSIGSTLYHLGAVKNGKWLWRTFKSTHRNYFGALPNDEYYDVGNGVEYAGGPLYVYRDYIITAYRGEFWHSGQANKYYVWSKEGLLIGTFGTTSFETSWKGEAPEEMAGNAVSGTLLEDKNGTFLYHCDESYHGGAHRWKLMGFDTIYRQSIICTRYSHPPQNNFIDLMSGLTRGTTLKMNEQGWTRSPTTDEYLTDTNQWSAQTGIMSYGKLNPIDIYVLFSRPFSQTNLVDRDLGSITVSNKWILKGLIALAGPANAEKGGSKMFFQILDSSNKVLSKFYHSQTLELDGYYHIKIIGNNVIITDGMANELEPICQTLQNLEITGTSDNIKFKYAHFKEISTKTDDATANWHRPKTVRMLFISLGKNHCIMSISAMKLFVF